MMMTAADTPLLEAQGLDVTYSGRVRAVQNFNLRLGAGEIVGLTGVSGSGKSTVAYALLGLTPQFGRINQGRVWVGGKNLLALPAAEQRKIRGSTIALIVQNPRAALHPIRRIGEQIGDVLSAHELGERQSDRELRRRAGELLGLVGIADPERRVDAFAAELSGGMAQRVLIAMALSTAPQVLIADEPTSGLDVTVQAQFLDLMWRTARERGMAMLLVTQEPGILSNYCDRILVMSHGKVVEDSPATQYFRARPQLARRTPPPTFGRSRPLLQVSRLSHRFKLRDSQDAVHAVSDVEITLREGETLGLVGESGSGKTTVGRCLVGLLSPSEGQIRFKDEPLQLGATAAARGQRRALQFVRQDPFDSLNPRWSIERNLREPLDLHTTLDSAAKRARVHELLAMVGCDPAISSHRPRDLGAGILQRVNIARALAPQPACIVLDEPTSMLEPGQRLELTELLRRLQGELGTAYLFISHDLTTIASLCHRVAVMYLGQIVEQGAAREIFSNPRHPYTRALLGASLVADVTRRRVDRPQTEQLAGAIPSPINLPKGCFLASRCFQAHEQCSRTAQRLVPFRAAPASNFDSAHQIRCWRATEQPLLDEATT